MFKVLLNSHFFYSIVAACIAICSGCAIDSRSSNANLEATPVSEKDRSELVWKGITIPIYGMNFAESERGLVIVGDGVVEFDDRLDKFETWPIGIVDSYLSTDGGITSKPLLEKRDASVVCSSENAVVSANRLYVYTICEHSMQVWSKDLDKTSAPPVLVHFTYCESCEPEDGVDGPNRVFKWNDDVVFLGNVSGDAALMKMNNDRKTFSVSWKSDKKGVGLVSLEFVDGVGILLDSDGDLHHSKDAGKTWKLHSVIPEQVKGKVLEIKFRNLDEGYLFGFDPIIYSTKDGGNHWEEEKVVFNSRVKRFSINDSTVAALSEAVKSGEYGKIAVKRNGEWSYFELPEGIVTDIHLFGENLLILVSGKLFSASMTDG